MEKMMRVPDRERSRLEPTARCATVRRVAAAGGAVANAGRRGM